MVVILALLLATQSHSIAVASLVMGFHQQGTPATTAASIELAVAAFIRPAFLNRRVGLQPLAREFATPDEPTGPESAPVREEAHLVALAQTVGARLTTSDTVSMCGEGAPPGCIDTLLRIGVPQVRGDSATVWVYVFTRREGGAEETDEQLVLARSNGTWRVAYRGELREGTFRTLKPARTPG